MNQGYREQPDDEELQRRLRSPSGPSSKPSSSRWISTASRGGILRSHERGVVRFYRRLAELHHLRSGRLLARGQLLKYREKLFTFIHHDRGALEQQQRLKMPSRDSPIIERGPSAC